MPAGYVRALFDQYAKHYDLSLLEGLDYRGPQLLFDAVMAACGVLGREPRFDRALDLGCGTGLASALFAPRVDSLVGVDLSPVMIEQARRTGRYNHLHVSDVLAFLKVKATLRRPRGRGGCAAVLLRFGAAGLRGRARARCGRAVRLHGRDPRGQRRAGAGNHALCARRGSRPGGAGGGGAALREPRGGLVAPGEKRPGAGAGRGGGETGLDPAYFGALILLTR